MMPSRRWSRWIVGPVWPSMDPALLRSAAVHMGAMGHKLDQCSASVLARAGGVASEQSGEAIDGFMRDASGMAMAHRAAAGPWFLARAVTDECAETTEALMDELDGLDAEAHELIGTIEARPDPLASLEVYEVVIRYAAAALAAATAAGGAITSQGTRLGLPPLGAGGTAQTGAAADPVVDPALAAFRGGGGGRGLPPLPKDVGTAGPRPLAPDESLHDNFQGAESGKSDSAPAQQERREERVPGGQQDGSKQPAPPGDDDAGHSASGGGESEPATKAPDETVRGSLNPAPPQGTGPGEVSAADVTPLAASPGLTGAGIGSGGIGSGGNSPVSAATPPRLSVPASTGGVGAVSPTGGPPPPLAAGAGGGAVPTSGSAGSADFSRGVNAGLGGTPAPPVMPPVASPRPAPAASAGMPLAAPASSPPPVITPATTGSMSAAAGGPPAASGVPSPGGAVSGGPMMPLPGPVGGLGGAGAVGGAATLPAFNSDIPRGPVVTPTSGPSAAPGSTTAGGGSTAAGPAALSVPGGVMAPVGGGAAGAVAGQAARTPDPLLVAAEQLVERLLRTTKASPHMDWCVAAFRTRSGIPVFVVASGEGESFLPRGVRLPAGVRLLHADPDLPSEFRSRWWGWANPVEPMLAYADQLAQWGTAELVAVAASTMLGGSVLPARTWGVEHIGEVQRTPSVGDDAPVPGDEDGQHRLAAVDPARWAQLTAVPDRSEAWRTTIAAARHVLARAAENPDVAVPAVIGEVLDTLGQGMPVPADQWTALHREAVQATIAASACRPGWLPSTQTGDDTRRCRAFSGLARLAEMLLEWQPRTPDCREIAYLATQIEAGGQ